MAEDGIDENELEFPNAPKQEESTSGLDIEDFTEDSVEPVSEQQEIVAFIDKASLDTMEIQEVRAGKDRSEYRSDQEIIARTGALLEAVRPDGNETVFSEQDVVQVAQAFIAMTNFQTNILVRDTFKSHENQRQKWENSVVKQALDEEGEAFSDKIYDTLQSNKLSRSTQTAFTGRLDRARVVLKSHHYQGRKMYRSFTEMIELSQQIQDNPGLEWSYIPEESNEAEIQEKNLNNLQKKWDDIDALTEQTDTTLTHYKFRNEESTP